MGNTQSAAENRKVAKPKTISTARYSASHSPAGKKTAPSPLTNIPYSQANGSGSIMSSPIHDGKTEHDYRTQIRSQMLAPEGELNGEEPEGQIDLFAAAVARSLSRKESRITPVPSATSSVTKLQSSSQVSLATERAIDLETAVAIIHELRKSASPDDLAALHQALLPTKSHDSSSPMSLEELEEELGTSAAALIRRRSLAVPGIATRYAKPERKTSSSALVASNGPLWKREMMGTSPLARLSSLDGLEPPPEIAENRAHTPADLEYSQLGNLKHGSLMVMNGPPSPVASIASRSRTARRMSGDREEEDFYTASESGSTYNDHSQPQNPENAPVRSCRPQTTEHAARCVPAKRSGSPLKCEVRAESLNTGINEVAENSLATRPEATRSAVSLNTGSEDHSTSEKTKSDEAKRFLGHQQSASQSSVSLACEYMAEMPPSPFITVTSGSLDTPSRNSEESYNTGNDKSFDEKKSSDSSVHDRNTVHVLNEPTPGPGNISPRKPLRCHPTRETLPPNPAFKNWTPVQAKYDSGYSSSASTTGGDCFARVEMDYAHASTIDSVVDAPKESINLSVRPKLQTMSSFDFFAQTRPITITSEPETTLEMEAVLELERILEPERIMDTIEQEPPMDEQKVKRSKSWRKSIRRSLPRLLSSETITTTSSNSSTPDSKASTKNSKPKRLQKKRPKSQPPLTIGDAHLLDRDIPRVPSTMFSRFSDRLSASPGMQHLDHTYANTSTGDLRRGSASPSPSAVLEPPLPASYFPDADIDNTPSKFKRFSRTIEQSSPPPPPPHRHRRSFRQSYSANDGEEELIGVTDFGTVAQSLGSSPYDIAMSGKSRRPLSVAPTLPHQLSTNAPRFGPREGWDAETASRMAHMRSRERAAQAPPEHETPARRSSLNDRRMSYHDQLPSIPERRQDPSMPRPKSMHARGIPNPNFRQINPQAEHEFRRVAPPPQHPHQAIFASRPKTAGNEQPPRSSSPVRQLVNVFEQRAAAPSHPPLPSLEHDWSEQSRIWRERKVQAQTSVNTTSSQIGNTTTTTTTVTYLAPGRQQKPSAPTRPALQNRKSMPNVRPLPQPPVELDAIPPRGYANDFRAETNANLTYHEEGMFGRYGGGLRNQKDQRAPGSKRDATPTTRATKHIYGIDLGDVPVRVI